jgi:hypothetical protein
MPVDQRGEIAVEVEKPAAVNIEQIAAHAVLHIARCRIALDRDTRRAVRKNQLCAGKAVL